MKPEGAYHEVEALVIQNENETIVNCKRLKEHKRQDMMWPGSWRG
jgi:hypothetical protein